LEQAEGP